MGIKVPEVFVKESWQTLLGKPLSYIGEQGKKAAKSLGSQFKINMKELGPKGVAIGAAGVAGSLGAMGLYGSAKAHMGGSAPTPDEGLMVGIAGAGAGLAAGFGVKAHMAASASGAYKRGLGKFAKGGLKAGFYGLAIAAPFAAFGYGLLEDPGKAGDLTRNLDLHSGPAAQFLASSPSSLGLSAIMSSRRTQGFTNLRGNDYQRGLQSASPPLGAQMDFSSGSNYERGMGADGNLSLALSNLRRGR